MTKEELQRKIEELGPWHQNHLFPYGLTCGDSPTDEKAQCGKLLILEKAGVLKRPVYQKVLDLGANAGRLAMWLVDHKGSKVDAIEGGVKFYPQLEFAVEVQGYQDKIKPIKGDITKISFLESEYDLILYLGTMHHLKPEFHKPVLEKCFKALVPGGEIVVQTKSELPVENLMKEVGFLGVRKLDTNWADRSAWFGYRDTMKI